ncbi:MAG: hypothetical protein AB8V03_06155 [Francisella endosymbiont of Hyalomma asiaticum]
MIYDIAYDEYKLPKQNASFIQAKISFWKSALLTLDQVVAKDELEGQAAFIYQKYQKYLKKII